MEYLLKVSPKGQVVLPKKLRESLQVKELVAIEVKDHTGIVKKPILSSDKLAGCFKTYASRLGGPLGNNLHTQEIGSMLVFQSFIDFLVDFMKRPNALSFFRLSR
jgi:bifunctional DNA-binding transcriptional regulator/antitoxin component of YhaV-PrlF toxin-antitoxin module